MDQEKEPKTANERFRKEALKQLAAPEEHQLLFTPITVRTRFAWWVFLGLIACIIAWLFLGSIPITLDGVGILENRKGLFAIQTQNGGVVDKIIVHEGQIVRKGQKVALLVDPETALQYKASQMKVADIESDLAALEKQVQTELVAQREALFQQVAAAEESIANLEKSIPPLEAELKTKESLYQEQLIGSQDVYQTQALLSPEKDSIGNN